MRNWQRLVTTIIICLAASQVMGQNFIPEPMVSSVVDVNKLFLSITPAPAVKVVFTDVIPQRKIMFQEFQSLLPGTVLPEDWMDYTYITFEWRSSTAQPFRVELYSRDGTSGAEVMASKTVQPYENTWTWVMLPLNYFRKAVVPSLANDPRHNVQYFVDTDHGSITPVKLVTAIGFRMDHPLGKEAPTLEIRNVSVGKGRPASMGQGFLAPLPEFLQSMLATARQKINISPDSISTDQAFRSVLAEKVVDKFGQWKPADWPGKIKTSEELQAAWDNEEKNLKAGDFGYDIYGGRLGTQAKGGVKGFFRVEQVDGKWWFVDPEGKLFYAAGVAGLANHGEAFTTKWKEFDTLLPRVVGLPPGADPIPGSGNTAFYEYHYVTRHDPTHISLSVMLQGHYDLIARRMEAWGLNVADMTLGGLKGHKKAYIQMVDNWSFKELNYPYPRPEGITGPPMQFFMGMADVYSPNFEKLVEARATEICTEQRKADPYLLGYQIDIGPPWITRESMFCDQVLAGPNSELKNRLQDYLKEGDTSARRRDFAYEAFDHYLSVMVTAIRKTDPNHLILGMGFQQADLPDEFFRFAKYFDVFSMNVYGEAPQPAFIERLNKLSGKPILISAFGFGAVGRGMGGGPAAVEDQTQRAKAYRYYTEQAAALPAVVGALWYGWVDQPALGQRVNTFMMRPVNGENYNVGMVDVTDRPYEELMSAMVQTHKRLGDIHSAKVAPTKERAERVVLTAALPGAAMPERK